MNAPVPVLELAQGRPVCTSLNVAEHFGKNHQHVMRDIRKLIADVPEECKSNFGPTSIQVPMPKGGYRDEPAYQLTRDGFTLLAFGFTGKRALAWKVKYIQAFNAMEAEVARLRAAPLMSAGLEERLAALELAVAGDAEALLLARLRRQATAVLGPETTESFRQMAGHTYPHDEHKRRALEAQLINVQLARLLNPRPRTRRARATH